MRLIYHITKATAWEQALREGSYRADSLEKEGFIHCSEREQVEDSANHYFKGQNQLVLLEIDPASLGSNLVYEESTGGQLFPHLYGPLSLEAVRAVIPFPANRNGIFSF